MLNLKDREKKMSDSSDLEVLEEKSKTNVIELDDSSSSSTENEYSKSSSNKPNGAECLARCKEFAKVTNTDTALAMFYLQDNDWNLEVCLSFIFVFYKLIIYPICFLTKRKV